ncbi:MAG TPA: hypothetical protein VKB12_02005 [Pyrinomonadaceae bacterium]|nr:hypothetical protein [Pyrinomonadaceae bacterium]
MKTRKTNRTHRLILVSIAITVAALTTIVTLSGQGQVGGEGTPPDSRRQKEEVESQFPTAELEAPEPADPEKRNQRRKKSARYNNHHLVNRSDGYSDAVESVFFDEWDLGLPAIPAPQSEVVVTGDVTNARAYLSNDKTGIYSEFEITVGEVFKNSASAPLGVNSTVIAERAGGAVRYPSKGKYLYRVSGQGMPRAGKRYVFFLKATGLEQTFGIVTAYELRGGKVFPLDSAEQFDTYKGMEGGKFLAALRSAIGRPEADVK